MISKAIVALALAAGISATGTWDVAAEARPEPAASSPQAVRTGSFPPAGYVFKAPASCEEDAEKAKKALRPGQATYAICADQMALFNQALAEARASGQLLLVTFGATWCPWCASLQKRMQGDELLGHKGDGIDYGATFRHIEIGLSMIEKGKKAGIPSGEAVLEAVLARTAGVKIRAIPFVAVIDPKHPERVWARNIDDIATKDGSHDLDRLRALLREARAHVLGQAAAPAEPGWLRRKWLRLWHS